jgi:hemolysin III
VEIANAITHGLGAALSVAALVILVAAATARGDGWYVTAYAVFGASAFFLYMASTLYHAIQAPRAKRVFEIFDHGAIFVLIAGSYTAFALTILRSSVGWWLFGAVWAIAAAGIVVEALFLNRWPFATLAGYLSMGWLIVLVWKPLNEYGSPAMVGWLFAGGACYTLGTVFYALGRKRGWFHPAWHLFVLGGSACHFFAALAALPS